MDTRDSQIMTSVFTQRDSTVAVSTSSRGENPSSILRLPNEILHSILSVFCMTPTNKWSRNPRMADSPILTARSVCRRFRAIAAELPLWFDAEFDMFSLRPSPGCNLVETETTKFLAALLADRYLAESLARKTGWYLPNLATVVAVLDNVAEFPEKASSLSLEWYNSTYIDSMPNRPSSLNLAIDRLRICRRITSIRLNPWCCRIDLDAFTNAFPLLEHLDVRHPIAYSGTFENFANLRSLRITVGAAGTRNTPFFLPLHSAKVLTTLSVEFLNTENATGLLDTTALDRFVNLTTLRIDPLSNVVCKYLIHTSARLTSFMTSTYRKSQVAYTTILSMFAAPSLQNLETLKFQYDVEVEENWDEVEENWDEFETTPIVEAIARLSSLQNLDLVLGLHQDDIPLFGDLIQLKVFTWRAHIDDTMFYDPERKNEDVILEDETKARICALRLFQTAFATFREMPQISVDVFPQKLVNEDAEPNDDNNYWDDEDAEWMQEHSRAENGYPGMWGEDEEDYEEYE